MKKFSPLLHRHLSFHPKGGEGTYEKNLPAFVSLSETQKYIYRDGRHPSIDKCTSSYLKFLENEIIGKKGIPASSPPLPPTLVKSSASSSRFWPLFPIRMLSNLSNLDLVLSKGVRKKNHKKNLLLWTVLIPSFLLRNFTTGIHVSISFCRKSRKRAHSGELRTHHLFFLPSDAYKVHKLLNPSLLTANPSFEFDQTSI
jgi:hypothetical protein